MLVTAHALEEFAAAGKLIAAERIAEQNRLTPSQLRTQIEREHGALARAAVPS